MNSKTMVVDSHQHFWDPGRLCYGWMPPAPHVLNRSYLPEDLAPSLKRNRVDGTILVQAIHSMAETAYLLDLARANDFIVGVVGWVDLTSPDVGRVLDGLSHEAKLVGIRHQTELEPDDNWLVRDDVIRGLREVARHGLAFDLLVKSCHLPLVPRLAAEVPGLRMVIDHIAKPAIVRRELEPWTSRISLVASLPNVHCKISGMVTEASHKDWRPEEFAPYVGHLIKEFGFGKLMWGSDWPVCLMAATYDQALHVATDFASLAAEDDRTKYLGRNALDFYGIRLG